VSIPEIRRISAEETIAIRWPILRPGFPRETAIFAGDDAPGTQHFGAFQDGALVGVASIYRAPFDDVEKAWQLRGMATLPEVRGLGCGRVLLRACEDAAGTDLLWCNARTSAVPFYVAHGWRTVGEEFDIATVGPHFRMVRS
jgi:GNAT superfamily N-acetyltransferase